MPFVLLLVLTTALSFGCASSTTTSRERSVGQRPVEDSVRIVVRAYLDEDGHPLSAHVETTTDERLNKDAIDRVMSMTFTPGVQGGKPVKVWVSVPITYRLDPVRDEPDQTGR
jgi:hypothetical protein